jgi:phospholipid transport system substrate-binding protein
MMTTLTSLLSLRTARRVVFASALALGLALATASPAAAQSNAQAFVEQEHGRLTGLLKQPAAAGREASISQELDRMVDYDELARRTFGKPCPQTIAQCQNHWDGLSEEQKSEVTRLLRKLVEKNTKTNLKKTVDYDVAFKGSRPLATGDTKIRTEAKSRTNPREAPVTVDYLVAGAPGSFKVVDIVTEGSSLTKNYYEQFHRMLTTPGQGYAHVVKRLNDKIAAR